MTFLIRKAAADNINSMVSLSLKKRLSYEKAQPQFWRYAGPDGDKAQFKWFNELLNDQDYLMFVAEDRGIKGFIIGKLIQAPEVYNPGGLTLLIDDFCVESDNLWDEIGDKLLATVKSEAKDRGAAQVLVVCGFHDKIKQNFLKKANLSVASQWLVGNL